MATGLGSEADFVFYKVIGYWLLDNEIYWLFHLHFGEQHQPTLDSFKFKNLLLSDLYMFELYKHPLMGTPKSSQPHHS